MGGSGGLAGAIARARWSWPALAALASLSADPGAVLPTASYYLRDVTLTFLPLRLFQARELASGRYPWWNPFSHEGAPMLPVFYPPELLHPLWPAPQWISWLLTLHLPLAALGGYLLARVLGAGRPAAFVSGAVYALGGLTLSSLNLYVFLQAAAWAPLQAASLVRAAEHGGRSLALAALVQALALTTLAVEFWVQAVVLGAVLALVRPPGWRGLGRLITACGLGVAVAGLPVLVTLGMLPETTRAQGSERAAYEQALGPWHLAQVLMPGVFGSLAEPVGRWWGGAFQGWRYPYFFSLYLGPLALAMAACGVAAVERRLRVALVALAAMGLWYALGPAGGLAVWLSETPLGRPFRFPAKAALMPHMVTALLTGFGAARLASGRGWRGLGWACGALGGIALFVLWCSLDPRAAPWPWPALPEPDLRLARAGVPRESVTALALVAAGLLAAAGVALRALAPSRAAALLAAGAVIDLGRAGAGLNPRVRAELLRLLPETAELRLDAQGGGRVFSYGTRGRAWPAVRERLTNATLVQHFLRRQTFDGLTGALDGVEAAQERDLTGFALHEPLLGAITREPAALGEALPRLRESAVARVMSLDPLRHEALRPVAEVDSGIRGLPIRVYALERPLPRAYVACRVFVEPSRERATWRALEADLDGSRDVVLERQAEADCTEGRVAVLAGDATTDAYDLSLDGRGLLMTRDSYARGWQARVDGRPAEVLRANGRYRAIPVPAGKHRVELRYGPPGAAWGLVISALAVVGVGIVAVRGGSRPA